MSRKDVAHGNIDSENISNGQGMLGLEMLAVSIGLGVWLNSWWAVLFDFPT